MSYQDLKAIYWVLSFRLKLVDKTDLNGKNSLYLNEVKHEYIKNGSQK